MPSSEQVVAADLQAQIDALRAQVSWLLSFVPTAATFNLSNPNASALVACV